PIADRHLAYAQEVEKRLKAQGVRVEVDDRADRMNAKIRDAQNQKIPYMLVVGDKEAEQSQVALRLRGGENPGAMSFEAFLDRLNADVEAGI
ncbi:MAG: His/Gly/Thr/Pro-type tRNA ligase C-terminal domain-containing protein, partial [Anaerolineaceae bacterium]